MVEASDGDVMIGLDVVGDATLDMASIMIAAGEMSGSATLTATEDDDDYMDETVTVVASGSGIDGSMQIAIAVTDNEDAPVDTPLVTGKLQAQIDAAVTTAVDAVRDAAGLWYTGEANIAVSELFDIAEGVTLTGDAGSSDSGVADARVRIDRENTMYSQVTVQANGAGTAMLTATLTATMPGRTRRMLPRSSSASPSTRSLCRITRWT